jgi:hypothetical protein
MKKQHWIAPLALAEAFAITDRPVLVHVKSSAMQASAWRKRTMPLPAT